MSSTDTTRQMAAAVLDAAIALATDGGAPPDELNAALADRPRPLFTTPRELRERIWTILAQPERARALAWLDQHGLLEELIPCFGGNPVRRTLRLDAMNQVHLEPWGTGIDDAIRRAICDVHDFVIDRRLNRWALTALATLLAGGDEEDHAAWRRFVRRDLAALGATEAELVWVDRVLEGITPSLLYLRGQEASAELTPERAVAALSTLSVTDPELLEDAVARVNTALEAGTNPLDHIRESSS